MTKDVHGEHSETHDHGSFLSKQRIIANPGFNRWLVPPAALAIHLCIGMAYVLRQTGSQDDLHRVLCVGWHLVREHSS